MKKTFIALLALAALLLSPLNAEPTVVANSSVKADSLSKDEVKNILLGSKSRWDDGSAIILAVLRKGPIHEEAIQTFTGRKADQFDKHWKRQVFSGKGIAPDNFETEEELCAFLAKTAGAIGYIGDPAKATGVKVISVN